MSADIRPVRGAADVVARLRALCAEAGRRGEPEPTAGTLSTADGDGRPSARIVLVMLRDERGPVVFMHRDSGKARQLRANPHACLSWFWPRYEMQVVVEARARFLPAQDAEDIWSHRPRDSKLWAWASDQTQSAAGVERLKQRMHGLRQRFGSERIPMPDHWCGVLLEPEVLSIWPSGFQRMAARERHERGDDGRWTSRSLNP